MWFVTFCGNGSVIGKFVLEKWQLKLKAAFEHFKNAAIDGNRTGIVKLTTCLVDRIGCRQDPDINNLLINGMIRLGMMILTVNEQMKRQEDPTSIL
jgi:hypothetical protein